MHQNKHRELGEKKRVDMFQSREEDKISEKEWNEMEITNLPEKEFNQMIIKILNLGGEGKKTMTKSTNS